jgi:hypothetical protein
MDFTNPKTEEFAYLHNQVKDTLVARLRTQQ